MFLKIFLALYIAVKKPDTPLLKAYRFSFFIQSSPFSVTFNCPQVSCEKTRKSFTSEELQPAAFWLFGLKKKT